MAMSCWARRCTSSACLRYPAMPVVVKTPALPVVVSPPASGVAGQWQIETSTDGVDARFVGRNGTLLGFALAGQATTNKTALQKSLPALLVTFRHKGASCFRHIGASWKRSN